MQIEVECSWKNKTHKAKQVICLDLRPKKIFAMPSEKVALLQKLRTEIDATTIGDITALKEQYPKSIYASFVEINALDDLEANRRSDVCFQKLLKDHSNETLTRCLYAGRLLKNTEYEKFAAYFEDTEVLKGVFPERKLFYIEEVMTFHQLWHHYFDIMGHPTQAEKHQKFLQMILSKT